MMVILLYGTAKWSLITYRPAGSQRTPPPWSLYSAATASFRCGRRFSVSDSVRFLMASCRFLGICRRTLYGIVLSSRRLSDGIRAAPFDASMSSVRSASNCSSALSRPGMAGTSPSCSTSPAYHLATDGTVTPGATSTSVPASPRATWCITLLASSAEATAASRWSRIV
ncbi:hypothetical protein D3C76_1006480 [compost metagenome]